MKQPDFTELFFETFQSCAAGVTYDVRWWPYTPHDVQFLSGLLHDAEFSLSEVELRRKRLDIPVSRDRWELRRKDGDSLVSIRSRLSISSVERLEIHATDCLNPAASPLCIHHIDLNHKNSLPFQNDWQCLVLDCEASGGGEVKLLIYTDSLPRLMRLRDVR